MNENFKQGKIEFDEKNYDEALYYLNKVDENDECYKLSSLFRIGCLVELKEYDEALSIINPMISEDPYSVMLWFNKVVCHIFLNEDDKALKALKEYERLIDKTNKTELVLAAKAYDMLGDYETALKYCDDALAIDENFMQALNEKSHVGIRLDDAGVIDSVADKLLELSENDILSLTIVFVLRIFSKNYEGCLEVVENSDDDEIKDATISMFKTIILKNICEDLNAQIMIEDTMDLSIDDALQIMFEFKNSGRSKGTINGIDYMIF